MHNLPSQTVVTTTSNKLASSKTPPLILLIDDDSFMRTQIRLLLQQETYRVVEASNGKEGLDAYKRLRPNLVLLDAMMPEMDGFECCTQLQSLPGAEQTPVLMITGLDDQASVDRAFAAGAVDFVTKPIHFAVLRQRVRRLIQQSHLYQELEAANQKLQHLAVIDSLTQLANRRQLDTHLDQEWRRTVRERTPLSVILCDVDCFKLYNDAYGHQAGDECLRRIAKAIHGTAKRPLDLTARYGGEEFAVILPGTNMEGALHIAQNIQAAVKALKLNHPNSQAGKYTTLSLGLATIFPHQFPHLLPETLLTAADQALYQAKAEGRDRYCVHSMSSPSL
jgi:diguanylate cyclase (GGDEF)-like protein